MNMRFAMAALVAAFLMGGFATIVTPGNVTASPEFTSQQATVHAGTRNMTATKNHMWPPASMITVEPCAVAQCSDA